MEKMQVVAALAALAQETRLDVFRLLVQAGGDGMTPGTIAERLVVPAATLSHHLNQLRHAGLIAVRRESRSLIYTADYPAMNALMGFLTENCCAGDPGACGLPACDPIAPTLIQAKGATRQ